MNCRLGNRVDGVEVQILRRNLLELPRRALGIEEVLAFGLHEALAPGVGAASLQPVREALGRLDLQGVVLGTAGWGIRVKNAAVLGKWVKCASQRIGLREAGIRRKSGVPGGGQPGLHRCAAQRLSCQQVIGIVVGARRAGSRIRIEAILRVRLL